MAWIKKQNRPGIKSPTSLTLIVYKTLKSRMIWAWQILVYDTPMSVGLCKADLIIRHTVVPAKINSELVITLFSKYIVGQSISNARAVIVLIKQRGLIKRIEKFNQIKGT